MAAARGRRRQLYPLEVQLDGNGDLATHDLGDAGRRSGPGEVIG